MRHERTFQRYLICSDCDGTGRVEVGRRGANDPDTYLVTCEECGGTGDAPADDEDGLDGDEA